MKIKSCFQIFILYIIYLCLCVINTNGPLDLKKGSVQTLECKFAHSLTYSVVLFWSRFKTRAIKSWNCSKPIGLYGLSLAIKMIFKTRYLPMLPIINNQTAGVELL